MRPANTTQDGPARILGLSNGQSLRNFTLAQGLWTGNPSENFNIRCRTTQTDMDGMPLFTTGPNSISTALQHVVYARSADGTERLFLNGAQVAQAWRGGDTSNWDSSFRLAVAGEIGSYRPWLGEMFLMAVYDRALSSGEVQQNFTAGCGVSNAGHLGVTPASPIVVNVVQGQAPTATLPTFNLSNVGGEALDWTLFIDRPWVNVSATSGSLQPLGSSTVSASLNASMIASLPLGTHRANLLFRNTTTGHGTVLVPCDVNVLVSGSNSGGNRPGPTNTGPNNPSNLSNVGGMTITQDGYVLENVRIFGTVVVQANNVTIRNFILDAGFAPYGIKSINGNTGLVIEDGEIYNVDSAGVYGSNFSAFRLNIHESGGDGIKTVSNALVEACWVHHLGMNPGAHADCNQTRQGGNLIFRGNYFDLPIDIGAPYKQNACWIVQTGEGPVDNVLIEGNWIEGGNYSLFIVNKYTAGSNLPNYGDPTNCRVINNRFGRAYRFGPITTTGYVLISGNVWDDDGTLMDINNG
ncbi:MAG: LamG-like jellyroll fold domain-containing protein [Planctomycetota bacterium]